VPLNAQKPPSDAQTLQPLVVDVAVIEHCFGTPGAGSPNTVLVQAVPPDNDL
jgi:hypothetical protein